MFYNLSSTLDEAAVITVRGRYPSTCQCRYFSSSEFLQLWRRKRFKLKTTVRQWDCRSVCEDGGRVRRASVSPNWVYRACAPSRLVTGTPPSAGSCFGEKSPHVQHSWGRGMLLSCEGWSTGGNTPKLALYELVGCDLGSSLIPLLQQETLKHCDSFGAVLKGKLLRTTVSVQVAETFTWLKRLFTAQPFWGTDEWRCKVGVSLAGAQSPVVKPVKQNNPGECA